MEETVVSLNCAELFISIWIILSLFVGLIGYKNKVGFSLALVWSIIFSPIIGLIFVLRYNKTNKVVRTHKEDKLV
jgi:predicted membrane protein